MIKGFSVLFLQILLFCVAATSHAATLYMDPYESELKRGDTMVIAVRLDTDEEECVNVVDAVITYTENIQVVDTSRGSSILSLWVEEPIINKENRTITFAGGIPNGYCGRIAGDPRLTNNVVNLLVQSPGLQIGSTESGNIASIDFAPETHVLLNDGFGTVVTPQTFGATVSLTRNAGTTQLNPWQDTIRADELPPEKFSINLERTENAYSNKYFITFNTTDKQSGIDHYEVIEEPLETQNLFGWGAETAPWAKAKSPYVLEDQSLNSTIRVRAIDKAGNEIIAVLVPDEAQRTVSMESIAIYGVMAFGALVAFVIISVLCVMVVRRIKRKKEVVPKENDHEIE